MRKLAFVLLLLISAAALAQVTPTGRFARPFPPESGGIAGSSGPLPDENPPSTLLDGLQAYWAFDASGGTNPAASSSDMGWDSAENFQLSRSGALPTYDSGSKKGGAGSIVPDTTSGAGLFSSDTALRQPGDFSVSMWSKHNGGVPGCADDGFVEQTPLFGMGSTTKTDAEADYRAFARVTGVGPARFRFQACDSVSGCVTLDSNPTSTFKHYVMAYNSTAKTFKLYVDNVLAGTSAALANGLRQTGVRFWILPEQTSQCQAYLDELAVWSVELDATKVDCLWNAGAGAFYPFDGVCN